MAVAPKVKAKEIQVKVNELPRTAKAARSHARARLGAWGWADSEWGCLEALWTAESNFRPSARNHTGVRVRGSDGRVRVLYAGGIPQILGLDPALSVENQVRRGFLYIQERYGSPCRAWSVWKQNGVKNGFGWY